MKWKVGVRRWAASQTRACGEAEEEEEGEEGEEVEESSLSLRSSVVLPFLELVH